VTELTLELAPARQSNFTMASRSRHPRRGFSLPAHGAVELIAGMAAMVAPAVLGFGAGGIVVSALLGAVLMGMGMTLTGRLGSAVSWHGSFDSVFVVLTAIAALGLALAGDRAAAAFLVVLVAIQALLSFTTRYVATA
jgi:hypothetical protein